MWFVRLCGERTRQFSHFKSLFKAYVHPLSITVYYSVFQWEWDQYSANMCPTQHSLSVCMQPAWQCFVSKLHCHLKYMNTLYLKWIIMHGEHKYDLMLKLLQLHLPLWPKQVICPICLMPLVVFLYLNQMCLNSFWPKGKILY